MILSQMSISLGPRDQEKLLQRAVNTSLITALWYNYRATSIISVIHNIGLMDRIWSPLTKHQFMCVGGFKFQFYGFRDLRRDLTKT